MKLHEFKVGDKIRRPSHGEGFYILIDPSVPFYFSCLNSFDLICDDWEYYKEKTKKTVTLYRRTLITDMGTIIQTDWCSNKDQITPGFRVIKTESKTVEYESEEE